MIGGGGQKRRDHPGCHFLLHCMHNKEERTSKEMSQIRPSSKLPNLPDWPRVLIGRGDDLERLEVPELDRSVL